ncbi:MAG: RNA 2',3'-cyclic phosphodiesterase [Gemmatimonadetes bacterium]|nr:RNA 2',3'-cyclic phosphodiesterase [Gemmatimonadota bacterium]
MSLFVLVNPVMRLFIGLKLPKKQKARIFRAARPLREEELPVRWVDPENFHVTLKFLGEVRRDRLPAIEGALGRIASETPPFSTSIGGCGAFPSVRRPRVIWVGVGACPELRCLKQDLEWTLSELGFDVETRAFHPHVTLGRARPDGGVGVFRGLDICFSELRLEEELRIHTVDLMESRLSPGGAKYRVVSGARLAAA